MKSNKNIFYTILFLVTGFGLFSQVALDYNNRWINHNQKYYKIKIPNDGLYRLDSTTLANAGILANIPNPQNIQLFQKGKEIYPYVAGEADGVFNTNDYILFYAEKNTAKDDSLLYTCKFNATGANLGAPFLTNPYYSVINDSATVFLTWNNSTTNNRLTLSTDTAYSSYLSSPYYYKEVYTPYTWYGQGPLNVVNQADPRYRLGQGKDYADQIGQGAVSTLTIPTSFAYKGTPLAYFTICVSGSNDVNGTAFFYDHAVQIDYSNNLGGNTLLTGLNHPDSLAAYNTHKYNYTVDPSNFGANTNINVTNLNNPNPNNALNTDNLINVNYIYAFYPHQFNMLSNSTEKIYLPDDVQGGQTKSKIVLTNFAGVKPILIDVVNHRLLNVTPSGSNFLSLVPNSGGIKFCYLSDSTSVTPVTRVMPINSTSTPGTFVNYFSSGVKDSAYIIISHPKLMYSAGSHGVTDYKNWRSSLSGGNFNVITASAEDLADQFGYGVDYNPLALRNFCKYLIDTANAASKVPPANLFLMGKGIHPVDLLFGDAYAPPYYADKCLVPTWGNPASDILITQGLPGSLYLEPAIPTGRLVAQTDADILAYLAKAQLHDAQTDDGLWKKRAIHFVGGNTTSQQATFAGYLNTCKGIFKDTLMGGDVYTFAKTSTAPVSVTTNDSVRQLINSGVSMLTFFGHGSPTGFDENIDDPQTYSNSPRFPLVLANSCFTGDINSAEQVSHSELFTLAPNNHGGIAYIATTTEGVANYLAPYSQEMYRQICYYNYGQSYATSIQKTVRKLIENFTAVNDTILMLTALEMTLHGDPAIKSYGFSKPDYMLTNDDVIFNTTTYPDQIGISIIMTNLGRAVHNNFVVLVRRNFPNGDTVKWYKTVNGPLYIDTLSFFVPLDYYRAVGKNDFFVTLNYQNHTLESDYSNNSTSGAVSLFIKGSDIEPVWPYKYAIVPDTDWLKKERRDLHPWR